MNVGLGGSRISHKRFRKNEEAIFEAYYKIRSCNTKPTPAILAKKAGISRATLYRHHNSIYAINRNYQRSLIRQYKSTMRRARNQTSAEQLLYMMLLFVVHNKRVFLMISWDTGRILADEMLKYLRESLQGKYLVANYSVAVFNIYVGEVEALLMEWSKREFAEVELEQVYQNLLYLTRTAAVRLRPIELNHVGS